MENDHVFPASEPAPERASTDNNKSQKMIIIIGVVILILGIGVGSFVLGKNAFQGSSDTTPTPSNQLNIIDTPTPTTLPVPTASISATLGPSKKPSVTPKASPTPTLAIKSKILSANAALDGFESSNGGGNTGIDIRAGRNVNLVSRGFVSFSLDDIPQGVTIKEATLRLYQADIKGSPYTVGGALKVDHLTYGDSLDNSDYSLPALSSSFVSLTSNATKEWKDADVTDQVKDDLANARSVSQYRIHFQTETTGGDTTGDFAYFESAENTLATGNTPQLVIKYY